MGRDEETAQIRRQTLHEIFPRDDVAPLGDLHAFVDVDAGVLAADDVFRGRVIQPQRESKQQQWHDRMHARRCRVPVAKTGSVGHRDEAGGNGREDQEPIERVPPENSQCERGCRPTRPRSE